jgi:carbonic anhydrase
MSDLEILFRQNREWADRLKATRADFFESLAAAQSPRYLWIGCSDSRVPANEIVDVLPGEIFVHRNIANVVVHTDLNCLSVMQFAVDVLQVRHIFVVGHYGCAGVGAALMGRRLGLVDNWLRHIQDVRLKHSERLETISEGERPNRLCELNVIEQVINVCQTTIVQDAWNRSQPLHVHGWVYALQDGLIRELGLSVARIAELNSRYAAALAMVDAGGAELRAEK